MKEIKFRVNTIDIHNVKGSFEVISMSWENKLVHVVFLNSSNNKEEKQVGYEDIVQYTGITDKEGIRVYEGHVYIGQRCWCDGYLKKKYPKAIDVICEVKYDKGEFYGREIKPVDEHKEAYENNHYREINYILEPFLSNNQNTRIEVIGSVYENPELIK